MTHHVQTRYRSLLERAKSWRSAGHHARRLQRAGLSVCLSALVLAAPAWAAPKATLVMDARTGQVFAQTNADTRLHPASLTKMMTLYLAFEAVERGELTMDTPIRISSNASSEIPSKLGLKTGQEIQLRYLVRAAAVKSANDAATAIAEGISGSERAFVERMNRTAQAMGMSSTHFENAHGLTEPTHLSTARDMSILARHLLYDYPEYYNLFSRLSADAGIAQVSHTNRSFLTGYEGADGIKTGYTSAAGYNLVASAARGPERIIATIFGAGSVAERTRVAAELIDRGFSAAPTRVVEVAPTPPQSAGPRMAFLASATSASSVQDHPLHGSFSYEEMIAGRRAHAGNAAGNAAETIRRGGFRAVAIPSSLRQVQAATAYPQDEILAAATAVITDLKRGAGSRAPDARSASADAGTTLAASAITRAGMSDLERALARGAEIPMGPGAPRSSQAVSNSRRGGFRAVALPHPLLRSAPMAVASATSQTPRIDDLFNIDELYTAPDLPENSIFTRASAHSLPTGPLVEPTRPRARPDDVAPQPETPSRVVADEAVPSLESEPSDVPAPDAEIDTQAVAKADTDGEDIPVVNHDLADAATESASSDGAVKDGPQPIALPW